MFAAQSRPHMKLTTALLLTLLSIGTTIHSQISTPIEGDYVQTAAILERNLILGLRGSDAIDGNSLCRIDAETGEVLDCTTVGDDPEDMAVTFSGRYVYIAFAGESAVKRFDLESMTLDRTIPLGESSFWDDMRYAEQVVPLGDSDDRVLVSLYSYWDDDYVGIIENGTLTVDESRSYYNDRFLSVGNTDKLINYDDYAYYEGLNLVEIVDGSLTDGVRYDILGSYDNDIRLKYADGFVYANGGEVISVTDEGLELVGTAPIFRDDAYLFDYPVGVAPLPAAGKVFYVFYAYDTDRLTMQVVDLATYTIETTYELAGDFDPYDDRISDLHVLDEEGSRLLLNFEEGRSVMFTLCNSLVTEQPPAYNGPRFICPDSELTLIAPADARSGPNQSILWSDGRVGDTIQTDVDDIYYYHVVDENGCPGPASEEIYVEKEYYRDGPPEVVTPVTTVLCKGTSVELQFSSYYQYTLVLSDGRTTTNGIFPITEPGVYSVQSVDNYSGCLSEASDPITFTASDLPAAAAPLLNVPETVDTCNDGYVTLMVTNPEAQEVYWKVDDGWHDFEEGRSLETFGHDGYSRLYSVFYIDANGCASPTTETTINFYDAPDPPLVQYNEATETLAATTYGESGPIHWFFQDELEAVTDTRFYQPKRSGFYAARLQGPACLSEASNLVSVAVTTSTRSANAQLQSLRVFPNPAKDHVWISKENTASYATNVTYRISSVVGHLVRSGRMEFVKDRTRLPLTGMANGVYLLELLKDGRTYGRQRLVVRR